MRPRIPENDKRRKISFTIDPIVYYNYINYCKLHNIKNKSLFIENLLNELDFNFSVEDLIKIQKKV
jgi:hypothetical protein